MPGTVVNTTAETGRAKQGGSGLGGGKGGSGLDERNRFWQLWHKVKQFLAKKPFPKFHNVYLQNVVK